MLRFTSILSGLLLGSVLSAPSSQAHSREEQGYHTLRNDAGFHPDDLSRYMVPALDDAVMQHIALRFDIEYRSGTLFSVLVPPGQAHELAELAPQAQLVDEVLNPWIHDASYDYRRGYRDYTQVRKTFEKWQQDHPQLVKLVDLPDMKSQDGKTFIVARITQDVDKEHPQRPNVVITAATHGDEHLTTESLLVNLEKLVAGYESTPRFRRMLSSVNLIIVPVVSPDSFLKSRRVHGQDPNRVYDYPGKSNPSTRLDSAQAMIDFYKEIEPAGVLDFHGAPPKGMIMCPWGYQKNKDIEDSTDRKRHLDLVKQMGQATPGYDTGPIWSTIYVAPGTSTDHNYFRHKMLAIVIEIGGGDKSPPISKIPEKAAEIEEATWLFVEALIPESGTEEEDSESSSSGENSSEESESSSTGEGSSTQDSSSTEEDNNPDSNPSEQKPSDKSSPEEPSPSEEAKKSPEESPKAPAQDSEKSNDGGGCRLAGEPAGALGWIAIALLYWRRAEPPRLF